MREPYHLTIRFRQQSDSAALDLETDDGAGDVATMALPFGADLPLVLRALDAAQFPNLTQATARIPSAERDRLAALGLWQTERIVPDIHARVGRALLATLIAEPAAAAILSQARAAARANGQALAWARAALYAEERDAASWYVPTLTIASRSDAPLYLLTSPADQGAAGAAGLAALAQGGVRRGALRRRDILLGAAGVATVTALVVSGLAPFITGGLMLTHAALTSWLAGLGANALSGWLAGWAGKAGTRLLRDPASEQAVLGEMASDLERRMAAEEVTAEAVAAFLERTEAIPTALDALATQLDAQTDLLLDLHARLTAQSALLQALRADLRRSDLIQGRLHHLLLQALAAQTDALLDAYAKSTERLSSEVGVVLAEVQALRDELRRENPAVQPSASRKHNQMITGSAQVGVAIAGDVHGSITHQSGGIDFGNARIGSIGSIVAGDQVAGDKVMGDKIRGDKVSNYGARARWTRPLSISSG